jgi:hypothetical protein
VAKKKTDTYGTITAKCTEPVKGGKATSRYTTSKNKRNTLDRLLTGADNPAVTKSLNSDCFRVFSSNFGEVYVDNQGELFSPRLPNYEFT